MPAEIVTATCCAQYHADFKVTGSRGDEYTVSFTGMEGAAYCTCKAWEFAPWDNKNCKHIEKVWKEACLWNPQWRDGGENIITPTSYRQDGLQGESCPSCGGPVVAVRIAV